MNEGPRNGMRMEEPIDPELASLYRESAREEPPMHVDAAILAAARREAGARPREMAQETGEGAASNAFGSRPQSSAPAAPFLHPWRLPLSIAAVIVLSVSVVTLMTEQDADQPVTPLRAGGTQKEAVDPAGGRHPLVATPPSRDLTEERRIEPQPSPKHDGGRLPLAEVTAPQLRSSTQAPTEHASERARDGRRDALESETARRDQASNGARPAAPAAALAKEKEGTEARPTFRDGPVPPAASPLMRPNGLAASSGSASVLAGEYEHQPPEKWGEKIVELRRQGRAAEAEELLAEFRRRFPQYAVPREWMP